MHGSGPDWHRGCNRPRVRITCIAAAATLWAWPAVAQTWAEAVRAGDYETAAERLHPLVVEQAVSFRFESEPFRQLAKMYAQGLGVPRDHVIACTLADLASRGQDLAGPSTDDFVGHEARVKASREFFHTLCDVLTAEERLAAGRALGCFMFGMPEDTCLSVPIACESAGSGSGRQTRTLRRRSRFPTVPS